MALFASCDIPLPARDIDQLIIVEPPVRFNSSGRPLPVPDEAALRMQPIQQVRVSIYPINNRFLLFFLAEIPV
jgi:hypothetical protein